MSLPVASWLHQQFRFIPTHARAFARLYACMQPDVESQDEGELQKVLIGVKHDNCCIHLTLKDLIVSSSFPVVIQQIWRVSNHEGVVGLQRASTRGNLWIC